MKVFDYKCEICNAEWEEYVTSGQHPCCAFCGSEFTRVIWKSVPVLDKAKSPYDLIREPSPPVSVFIDRGKK